jgi:hypothetical protein
LKIENSTEPRPLWSGPFIFKFTDNCSLLTHIVNQLLNNTGILPYFQQKSNKKADFLKKTRFYTNLQEFFVLIRINSIFNLIKLIGKVVSGIILRENYFGERRR